MEDGVHLSTELLRDGAMLTASAMARALPSQPLFSSTDQDGSDIIVQRYVHPPSSVDLPGLRENVVVLHLAKVLIEEFVDGQVERRWATNGGISITPAGTPVRRNLKGRTEVVLIYIAQDYLTRLADGMFGVDANSVRLRPCLAHFDQTTARIAHLLFAEVQDNGIGSKLMIQGMAQSFAVQLLRSHSTFSMPLKETVLSISPGALTRVVNHMREHCAEPLSVADLANLTRLSPSHFTRAFRAAIGRPPHQHLLKLRIEQASRLLEETDLPVTEVALRCGFSQPTHFATMFAQKVGLSPRAWRSTRRQH